MSVPLNVIKAKFPNHKPPRATARGREVIIETCPLNPHHKPWKFGINIDTGWAYCYICQPRQLRASDVLGDSWKVRRIRREITSPRMEVLLPPLPRTESLEDCGLLHPAILYLTSRRRPASIEDAHMVGIRWKPEGLPAWSSLDPKTGKKRFVGTQGGLVIPVYLRGHLLAWQFAPVDKKPNKYLNAPGSKLTAAMFNFDRASKSSIGVIVEGVFDALRIPDIGMALLTDNVSERKSRLLSTVGFDELVVCLDNDRTDKHIEKQVCRLLNCARVVRSVKLENGDPDDHSAQELRKILGV